MRLDIDAKALGVTAGLGLLSALLIGAPSALAAPVSPTPPAPPPPAPVTAQTVPVPSAQPALAAPAPTTPAPAPHTPPGDGVVAEAAAPVEGTPHLPSPQNLPPNTTMVPTDRSQSRGLTYLRELWHAVRTQEVSGEDALLLLTQRPLDPNATPPPGLSAHPNPPPGTAPPPPAAPAPAP
ncbi:hypothetical protein ABQE44_18250 [Mycolicibacterium sp. XJ2546]